MSKKVKLPLFFRHLDSVPKSTNQWYKVQKMLSQKNVVNKIIHFLQKNEYQSETKAAVFIFFHQTLKNDPIIAKGFIFSGLFRKLLRNVDVLQICLNKNFFHKELFAQQNNICEAMFNMLGNIQFPYILDLLLEKKLINQELFNIKTHSGQTIFDKILSRSDKYKIIFQLIDKGIISTQSLSIVQKNSLLKMIMESKIILPTLKDIIIKYQYEQNEHIKQSLFKEILEKAQFMHYNNTFLPELEIIARNAEHSFLAQPNKSIQYAITTQELKKIQKYIKHAGEKLYKYTEHMIIWFANKIQETPLYLLKVILKDIINHSIYHMSPEVTLKIIQTLEQSGLEQEKIKELCTNIHHSLLLKKGHDVPPKAIFDLLFSKNNDTNDEYQNITSSLEELIIKLDIYTPVQYPNMILNEDNSHEQDIIVILNEDNSHEQDIIDILGNSA